VCTEKISVIVPLYNSASVIEKCVNSVINQTYTNIEVVLVDDGSTDNSSEICVSFQDGDSRVKCFRKENGGVSSARNFGLQMATGSWVTFLDSDDFIEKDFLANLMQKSDTEMMVGGFKRFGDKHDEIIPLEQYVNVKKDLGTLWNKTVEKFIYWYPWGKIYKLDIIKKNNLQFNEQMFYSEDFCFLLSYLGCIESFSVKGVANYCHLYEKRRAKKYKMDFDTFQRHLSHQDEAFINLESKHGHFYKLVRQNVHRRLIDNFLYNLMDISKFVEFKYEWNKFCDYKDANVLLKEISTSKTRKLVNFLVFKTHPVVGYVLRCILKKHLA